MGITCLARNQELWLEPRARPIALTSVPSALIFNLPGFYRLRISQLEMTAMLTHTTKLLTVRRYCHLKTQEGGPGR